jgi:hypothetical protein
MTPDGISAYHSELKKMQEESANKAAEEQSRPIQQGVN